MNATVIITPRKYRKRKGCHKGKNHEKRGGNFCGKKLRFLGRIVRTTPGGPISHTLVSWLD